MKFTNHILIFAIATLFGESSAMAAYSPELYRYFDQKITQVKSSVAKSSPSSDGAIPPMVLQDINIDLIPSVSFGLSDVLSFSIAPEIDFVLVPDGP